MLLDQGFSDSAPSLTDYIFILPKLIWPKPPGKVRWKTRVKSINERIVLAQQGKWKTLFDLSMELPIPTYDPNPDDELLDEPWLIQGDGSQIACCCLSRTGRQSLEANAITAASQAH